jgi:hypothetical protein
MEGESAECLNFILQKKWRREDACLRRHDGNSRINFRIIAVNNFLRFRRHSRAGGDVLCQRFSRDNNFININFSINNIR